MVCLGHLFISLAALAQPQPEASDSADAKSDPSVTKDDNKSPIDGIRDNSFLIEEAYNQEAGVVQHIFTGMYSKFDQGEAADREWNFSFTQEWPVFSQTHQLSYTLPYAFMDSDRAEHDSGLGDVLLNYRYQLTNDAGAWPAISPRVSLVFPSGDEDRELGTGVLGYQFNLPVSKTLTDHLYVNLNAGFTYFPDVGFEFSNGRRPHGRDLLHFNLGASVIYALTQDVHLMLEAAGNFDQELEEHSTIDGGRLRVNRRRACEVVISPGIRWATNLPDDLQLVSGLAFPIGVTDEAMDYGVFLYLSIEHPFVRNAID